MCFSFVSSIKFSRNNMKQNRMKWCFIVFFCLVRELPSYNACDFVAGSNFLEFGYVWHCSICSYMETTKMIRLFCRWIQECSVLCKENALKYCLFFSSILAISIHFLSLNIYEFYFYVFIIHLTVFLLLLLLFRIFFRKKVIS